MNLFKGQVRALGLCSGGLDSILSALILKQQGIEVSWVSFETPFFSADFAKKAASQTGIQLIIEDITNDYLKMLRMPKTDFGKNMNPCLECHTMMFSKAGALMKEKGFHFMFSGEIVGQRPKSQTKNSLRYIEKHSGYEGYILRPLSAKTLPETEIEKIGLVDRTKLMDITGRSRKRQIKMAIELGIWNYPSPAGGCLLTDPIYSRRLRDLLFKRNISSPRQFHLLKYGRHFNLNHPEDKNRQCKLIVGRSEEDNNNIMKWYIPEIDILLRHNSMPGPDALVIGCFDQNQLKIAAMILAAYTKTETGKTSSIRVISNESIQTVSILRRPAVDFKNLMI